ncbi:MAG: response regulator [Holophagales bacterium]|jgi:CheY-like chemotaxis protein|nr:response regulator [Holophagales bacterium]
MNQETNIRILYIEDNPANYRLVHRLLSHAGFEMYWAEEGAAGFDLATQVLPDLILMDINLPGLSGFELTTKFRGHPDFKDTPIIALTAKTQRSDRETALVAGCNGFIPKPIDPFNFVSQIRAYLGGLQERLDKGAEGRALRHFNVHLLEHLEQQLQEAREANEKLLETQQTLETTNKSLARLISLGQNLMREYDPWLLLKRMLHALFLEITFDTFTIYLQHSSSSYWEGLHLAEKDLAQSPVLLSDHPFIQRLLQMDVGNGWFEGSSLLAMPIWTEGYQIDIWQSNGQPCLFLNLNRKNRDYIRGFWAFDRKNDRPFIPRELEMVRLYGRLTQVCLENAEMIREMDEKSKALSASYENLEVAYMDIQRAKSELQKKDRHAVLTDIFTNLANYLKEPITAFDHNCQLVIQAVQPDDDLTKQAILNISQFATQVKALFQALLRRTQAENTELPEWIDLESLLNDEIAFMEVEGLLASDKAQVDINLLGTRVYGIYSDFIRLLRIMLLNSAPTPEALSLPRQLRAWREENYVNLEVRDFAGQIQQQAIECAFEPFQGQRESIPGVRAPHGALPSVSQMLNTYDGNIALENTDNGVVLKATISLGI